MVWFFERFRFIFFLVVLLFKISEDAKRVMCTFARSHTLFVDLRISMRVHTYLRTSEICFQATFFFSFSFVKKASCSRVVCADPSCETSRGRARTTKTTLRTAEGESEATKEEFGLLAEI